MNPLPSLLAGGVVLAFAAAAHASNVDHHISDVTVYPDRALVTRTGEARLERGVQQLVFEGLPMNLDENSVRATATGGAKFQILGVELRRQFRDKPPQTEVTEIEAQLEALGDQRTVLDDRRRTADEERAFLDQMRGKVLEDIARPREKDPLVSADQLKGLLDFYATQLAALAERQRGIALERRTLDEQEQNLRRKLSLLQRPSDPDTRSAVVTVEVERPGSAELAVSYLMHGASWSPQYDAHADLAERGVTLTCYGVVRQTTGENWDNVTLKLSTARPSAAARLPELEPWRITLLTPDERRDWDARVADSYGGLVKEKAAARGLAVSGLIQAQNSVSAATPVSEPMPAGSVETEVSALDALAQVAADGPAALFEVPGRSTIPSDGQPHRNTVSRQDLKGKFSYEVTPKLAQAAFLKAHVDNTSGAPLLAGPINVFLGNDFVGRSYIKLVAARAAFDVYLGPDDGIKVTRKDDIPKEETGGILSAVRTYKRGYTITVENFKPGVETFTVHDQIPVSQKGSLEVTGLRLPQQNLKQNKETGELIWTFDLKPQEKRTLAVGFEVQCDPNAQIVGL